MCEVTGNPGSFLVNRPFAVLKAFNSTTSPDCGFAYVRDCSEHIAGFKVFNLQI